jgi:hypothetical protein
MRARFRSPHASYRHSRPADCVSAGSIAAISFNRTMVNENTRDKVLDFFVVEAPNPREMPSATPLLLNFS